MTAGPAFSIPVRVYYEDTDFSGVVYHASYLRFMERARTDHLRSLGFSQQSLFAGVAGEAIGFAVRRMEIDFLKPARMDDMLTVTAATMQIGGASIDLVQSVLRGEDVLIKAKVRVACIAGGRPVRIPSHVRELLEQDKGE